MITVIRENIKNLPYSLHDMTATGMTINGSSVKIDFKDGYEKTDGSGERVSGYILFEDVDFDFCYVYVLDFCGNVGGFTGEKYFLSDFIGNHRDINFEIIDEVYGYNRSKFCGYLRTACDSGQNLYDIKECALEIYHGGDMKYCVYTDNE